ncbi:60S ribosomal protein L23A-like [Salvia divinorum]|uniref:60S ribosomal protein L23A-like n=1 Tax=Salvia divinorum TaxID=28513 RepID=A0ABD1IJD6_SALDI
MVSAARFTSASTKLSSPFSTFLPVRKDVIGSFKAFEIKPVDRVSVSTKAENYLEPELVKQDFMSTDALTLKFENAIFLEPAPSPAAKKSKKEGPESSSAAKNSKKEKNPKRLSTSAALIKSTDHFQIFRYPLGTEPDGTKKAYIMLPPDYKAADVAKRIEIL